MNGQQFTDAQQAAGFAVPALYRTHTRVFEQKYPSFDYAGLVPVNTDGDLWDVGTLVYSGDIAGVAHYIGGKAFDIPNASVNWDQGVTNFHLAGVGYELSLQEVNRASKMGVGIDGRKAAAARMVAEKFIYDRVISGSTGKGFTGLINNALVPQAAAPSGTNWNTATPQQKLADVNAALTDVYVNSGETATANALILPTSKFLDANNTQMTNVGMSVLTFLKTNNSYTALTGQPLDIRPSRELTTAGAGATARMIAYEKSPDNMEFFLPGDFEFMPPFATSSMTWRVDGVMNVGQLEIYRPRTVSYRDGI
jgi:hypothetical protein